MPRFRRKRWGSFKKRVKAVIGSTVASKYTVFVQSVTIASVANKQASSSCHTVMGLNGAVNQTDDVSSLFLAAFNAGLLQTQRSGRIVVTGWLCETQVYNAGSNAAWVDMYYWRCKRRVSTVLPNFSTVWSNALADMSGVIVPAGGSTLDVADYGVTPFQGPELAKSVQIWKKTRALLPVAGVIQVETRSGKNYMRDWTNDEEYSMDTCTEGVFFVVYGVPGANLNADATTVKFSVNKNYTWKVVENASYMGATNVA